MNTRIHDMVRTFRALNPRYGFQSRVLFAEAARAKMADAAPSCELFLYDAIGADFFGEGITAKLVTEALKAANGATALNVYINSPGGDVFEATAIYNAIKRFSGTKTMYIDGLAASAASYIAMAGDVICTAKNAMWMIHNPWGMAIGDADDMRAVADSLDKVKGTMVGVYSARSKQPEDRVSALLDAETWMTADEAKKMGFTDKVQDPDDDGDDDSDEHEEPEKKRSELVEAIRALSKSEDAKQPDVNRARERLAAMTERMKNFPKRGQPRAGSKK